MAVSNHPEADNAMTDQCSSSFRRVEVLYNVHMEIIKISKTQTRTIYLVFNRIRLFEREDILEKFVKIL